jgi:peptidoglycan/xylan/chitin deacetylase (PgdA/CDA1 family)
VKATFFMGGKWAESHPREAAFLGSRSQFEIGSHSWSHIDLSKATDSQLDEQIDRAQTVIAARTGRTPLLFRLPFGFSGPNTVKRISEHGLWTIQWDVVTGDPDPDFRTKQIMQQVRESLGDGSIIIMHANGKGRHTAEALPTVLDYLKSKGYEIVTVGELMGYL